MEVIAWNRTPRSDAGGPLVDLDTLLARADVVSLNLALNDETRGIIDARRIARMKRGVILINTARGALVDEAALIEGLRAAKSGAPGSMFSMPSRSPRITRSRAWTT